MDAITLLHDDHERTLDLLQRMLATSAEQIDVRTQLYALLQQEFELHARVEEDVFCQAMDLQGDAEHRQVEVVRAGQPPLQSALAALGDADPSDPDWIACATALRDLFDRHIHATEDDLFPRAHHLLADELDRMGECISREKADLLRSY